MASCVGLQPWKPVRWEVRHFQSARLQACKHAEGRLNFWVGFTVRCLHRSEGWPVLMAVKASELEQRCCPDQVAGCRAQPKQTESRDSPHLSGSRSGTHLQMGGNY